MVSIGSGHTLLSYIGTQDDGSSDTGSQSSTSATLNARVKTALSTTAAAALQTAANRGSASIAGQALDRQQAALAGDLRSAMSKAGVKLSGAVEFSVGSDGTVATRGSAADKTAVTAFLNADKSKPGFASRIATQAKDALALSASVQKSAAVSQAARYGSASGGVMALYASLMQQTGSGTAVFTVAAGSSSLTYPGSLAAKA